MAAGETGPQAPKPKPGNQPSSNIWFWWLILVGLAAWNVVALWPHGPELAAIPYSTFLDQLRAGNVSQVHIIGDRITGTFAKPLLWPKPTQSATSKAEPPAGASPKAGDNAAKPPQVTPQTQPPPIKYSGFRTTFPTAVGDPGLMPLLEAHNVVVEVSPASAPWFLNLVLEWSPMLFLIGFFWWMARRSAQTQSGMFGIGRIKARRYNSDQPKVTFNDVAGADEAKADLQEEVDFLRNPKKYHDLGARIPRGVLLVGPPGTGKTLLARAVAGEAGVPFFSLTASEFVEMFVGVGASRVRDLFRQAKEAAPAIVFIDELDAVGRRRGAGLGTVNDEREQTLNQMLGEMDGFAPQVEVIILAATNRPDVLDPALLRPGRFDRQIVVPLPDKLGREGILRIHSRHLHLDPDVNIPILAATTIGMSGADLANLCNEAALATARHNRNAVSMADFDEALDKIRLGAAHPQLVDPSERRVVAYHESGHAVIAWLTPAADSVHKVTIVPHGQALGLTEMIPGEERHNLSYSFLKARLAVMLGGRAAEEIAIGDVTTGAENDLVEATRLARRMMTRWGMGKMGLAAFKTDEQQPFLGYEISQGRDYSEHTAARIDEEVRQLLEDTHQEVIKRLTGARDRLDQLVSVLLAEETVGTDQLERILGPRPVAVPAQTDGRGPVLELGKRK
ncbi:MAG TPA: ATP-dependent zinc metalloprotease FtsH [Candidatus Binataceae bacterium]|jgi:cell division protease FtsH|nr:ATP-dependent zinc metalloprotease FtsH [Candidatus Binataceae bacterium]